MLVYPITICFQILYHFTYGIRTLQQCFLSPLLAFVLISTYVINPTVHHNYFCFIYHFFLYLNVCGQEFLRRNGIALIVKKESKMQYLDATSKTTE